MTNNIEGRLNRLEHKQGGGGIEYVKITALPGTPKRWEYQGAAISEDEFEALVLSKPNLIIYVLYRAGERVEAHPGIEGLEDQTVVYIPDNGRD